jgi:hypothetical protein
MTNTSATANPAIFRQISARIIRQQEMIIGPIAWAEAKKVSGLRVLNQANAELGIDGSPTDVLNRLVAQYSRLFGRASTEACKEAVLDLLAELPTDQVPESLK